MESSRPTPARAASTSSKDSFSFGESGLSTALVVSLADGFGRGVLLVELFTMMIIVYTRRTDFSEEDRGETT